MNLRLNYKLREVRLIAFDVDGTLTDGTIYIGPGGEMKGFSAADGLGIRLLIDAGVQIAFISGRHSDAVTRRAKELDVTHVYQGVRDKAGCLTRLAGELGLTRMAVAAMGDDLPDLEMFGAAGVRLAVANATREVRALSDYVSTRRGGAGAAREVAELILRAQDLWDACVASFLPPQDPHATPLPGELLVPGKSN